MITLQPETITRGDEQIARPRVRILYAGTGPATFLSQKTSYELDPDILMPPLAVQQGLWVVPAPAFPVSLPGGRPPQSLLQTNPDNLLDVKEAEPWPSEAPVDRLLRFTEGAYALVLLTCPEYEAGWREALDSDSVTIAVLRGLSMPDGTVADARIEVPESAADLLAGLPLVLAELAGRDSMEADEQQVELLSSAQPMLQSQAGQVEIAPSDPQEARATNAGTVDAPPAKTAPTRRPEAVPAPIKDQPTNPLRAPIRTPPAAPRLSQAVAPTLRAPAKAPAKAPTKADTNPHPWERSEAGALNAIAHHARCEGHAVERQSTTAGGIKFRAAPSCRILAEVPEAGEADDGSVLLG